ncbi:GIP [Symbiodinium sp. CCMP2592]|nr:GIP [Symbiodinium sp. CCMP2592]
MAVPFCYESPKRGQRNSGCEGLWASSGDDEWYIWANYLIEYGAILQVENLSLFLKPYKVHRAVQAIPTAVEGIVNGGNQSVMEGSPAANDAVEYASVRSSASLDGRRDPPLEANVPTTPLFDERVLSRLNQMPAAAPHLYATDVGVADQPRPSSVSSSDIQAEVRRQLGEMMALHEDESKRLRAQVERLAAENRRRVLLNSRRWVVHLCSGPSVPGHVHLDGGFNCKGSKVWMSFEKWKCIATNLIWEFDNSFDPVRKDEGGVRTWTHAMRAQVVRSLEGRRRVQSCEILDEIISKGLRGTREVTHVDDEEERLLRAFEEESVVSSSEEEQEEDQPRVVSEEFQAACALKPSDLAGWKAHLENGSLPKSDPTATSDLYGLGPQSLVPDELGDYEPSVAGREPQEEFPDLWDLDEDWRDNEEDLQEQLLSSSIYAVDGVECVEPASGSSGFGQPTGQAEGSPCLEDWDEVIPEDKVEFERMVEELSQPTEQVVLRYFVELRSKSGADVADAVQRMVLEINKLYPVRILHCDLGTEFLSTKLSHWLSSNSIRLQHSLPADKQANGLAERTVAWVKSRSRTLIGSSGVDVQYWPLAARWAVESHNRILLGKTRLPMFGNNVLHRLKKPRGGLNDLMSRWVMVRYMCPHSVIPEGHVLLTPEGNLVASKGFRANTVDPEAIPGVTPATLQDLQVEHEDGAGVDTAVPSRRLRAKTAVRFLEVSCGSAIETRAYEALMSQDFSDETFRTLSTWCVEGGNHVQDRRGDFNGRAVFGAFCHGGNRGVTKFALKYPWLTQFLNHYMRFKLQTKGAPNEQAWASLMITPAVNVEMHRDFRNEWGSKNSVVCIPGPVDLWVDQSEDKRVIPLEPHWNDGGTRSMLGAPITFDPRRRHAVRKSPDLLLVAYTPLGSGKLLDSDRVYLEALGFFGVSSTDPKAEVRVVSASGRGQGLQGEEEPDQEVQTDLMSDLQEDSVAQVVGWDPAGSNSTNVPQLNLEERDLYEFFDEREVSRATARMLEYMGVESPADLAFLYFEDLVEFGVSPEEAQRAMRGIHPLGTRRPDNPTLCALRTGEVRLYDRSQRQIPWVFQNRTLDQQAPGPPVQGLGINLPQGPDVVLRDNRDWLEIEEERRDDVEELRPSEICVPVLPAEPSQSQVIPEIPSGSNDVGPFPSLGHANWTEEQAEMIRLQNIWDYESEDEWNLSVQEAMMSMSNCNPEVQVSGQSLECSDDAAEISVLPAESSQSQVQNDYVCKAIRSPTVEVASEGPEVSAIGVPTWNPTSALDHGTRVRDTGPNLGASVQKVDDTSYTKDVEGILSSLSSGLRVVHNVSPSEVRLHLERWKDAAQTEVAALETMGAIRRLRGQEAQRELNVPGTQVLPAKTVFTVKPGSAEKWFRRKCRVVGCGNFEVKEPGLDVYAGGIPADVLRTSLIESGSKGYHAFITDVRNAFLLAPIPIKEKVRILLKPPRVLCDMGITSPDEYWAVDKAMYGLRQSPRWWGNFRDDVLREARWSCTGRQMRLTQCEVEPNLWTIEDLYGQKFGFVIVYVDDILILSDRAHADALHSHITSQWECTPLQEATESDPVTFLGVDIQMARDAKGTLGFQLSQTGYIDELLRTYSLNPKRKVCPLPREWVKDLPEPEQYEPETLRKAQRITGELLWITQRTRVDLAYAVSLMSSWSTRAPSAVVKIGIRLLEYIGWTKDYKLSLIPDLSQDRRVVVYTDASFAPYGGLSVTGVLIMISVSLILSIAQVMCNLQTV